MPATECTEYKCYNYGGYECPKTRIADSDTNFKCKGPYTCNNCKHWHPSDADGLQCDQPFCSPIYMDRWERKEV
jgi:hypothetical protein